MDGKKIGTGDLCADSCDGERLKLLINNRRIHDASEYAPYSESQFKTMKYRPDFPDFFGSLEDARAWVRPFFDWYNREHYHISLGLLTPASVHYGQAAALLEKRQRVLDATYAAHPERFVKKTPTVQSLPTAVWINRPQPLLETGVEPPLGA